MDTQALTTLFVVPVGTAAPSSGSTQDLAAGQVGLFDSSYALVSGASTAPHFYVAQGRENTYMQGSKRSEKIIPCVTGGCRTNIMEVYKTNGCATPLNQIMDIGDWNVKCGQVVSLTIRAHSAYLDTLYFNGLTRSVTVNAPCCECGEDPCTTVDVDALIDAIIVKLTAVAPGSNPDNWSLSTFFTFERVGTGATAVLRITGKALTKYGNPCDVAAFPHEYDRMWFRTFVYEGPDTTADFIVSDACNIVAESTLVQASTYAFGTPEEVKQMEKNYYSYNAGYLKHLFRTAGYNQNFESFVSDTAVYDLLYIKLSEPNVHENKYGDYVPMSQTVIIALPKVAGVYDAAATALLGQLEDAGIISESLAALTDCAETTVPTTTTTTAAPTTTTTTVG